jgi:virulence-associated protein VagC
MESVDKSMLTRVFRAGNSQAVRIPKALELEEEGEVYIERRGNGLYITPKRGRWQAFFAGEPVDIDINAEQLRDTRAAREVDLS